MRVAVVTQSRDRVGGVEAYLQAVLPALARRCDVSFWSASDVITNRGAIILPSGVPGARLDASPTAAARQLRGWRPDVVFTHGLDHAALEASVVSVAPAVMVQHTYHGTCISSSKTRSWPGMTPCTRPLGPGCLVQYFPRRCGGVSPVTMATLYRVQTTRRELLRQAAVVMTLSQHMADEARRNGVPADRVHVVPPFAPAVKVARVRRLGDGMARLLFLGRLEPLKGARHLLQALAILVDRLDRPVSLVVAGDGSEREALERQAASLSASDPRLRVRFTGWQGDVARARLLTEADALVLPSLWPEPFGLVGLEAAAAGVPAVAFASGGIPEWLQDGINGCLAPAAGLKPALLAAAIARCIESPDTLARLGAGARATAAQWTIERHIGRLHEVLSCALKPAPVSRAS
jgi:glycosyltransferase involved in cell wall biosynthesis